MSGGHPAPPGNSGTAGRAARWALLVGIDKYQSADIDSLQFSVADVRAVAKSLVNDAGFPADNVVVMASDLDRTDSNYPTSIRVLRRLNALSNHIQPGDTFLFYFSGHGFQKGEGHHFLATVDAELGDEEILQQSTIPLDRLKERMKHIQAHQIIFVLDACRNDPERAKGLGSNVSTPEFSRDLKEVAAASGAGPEGSAVLFACSEGQRSYEWPDKQHGAFTYFLLEGLMGKAAEPNGDITINDLADYIQRSLKDWGRDEGKTQTPDLETAGAGKIVVEHHMPR